MGVLIANSVNQQTMVTSHPRKKRPGLYSKSRSWTALERHLIEEVRWLNRYGAIVICRYVLASYAKFTTCWRGQMNFMQLLRVGWGWSASVLDPIIGIVMLFFVYRSCCDRKLVDVFSCQLVATSGSMLTATFVKHSSYITRTGGW